MIGGMSDQIHLVGVYMPTANSGLGERNLHMGSRRVKGKSRE
jgi:hypothetical protein